MYKKIIEYVDFEGNTRKEAFYFHFSKAELTEMELSKKGGFQAYIEKIMNADDREELLKLFKGLILNSYGEKSDDGKRFIKSPELSEAFSQTNAYSELYVELITNTDAAIKFVNMIVPEELRKNVSELKSQLPEG